MRRNVSLLQWIVIALGLALVAAAAVPVAVTWIESRQARDVRDMEPWPEQEMAGHGRTAVVFFSRSGNTALAARHVARRLNARLIALEADEYRLGLWGWINPMRDARGEGAAIAPQTVDLDAFDTVYLGSPVWLYSPAPPIWNFVTHNRFDGKRVVLFNTFNSEFKPEFIAEFGARAMANGAVSFDHLSVQRGRMTQQMTPQEMLRAIDAEWFSRPAGAATGPDTPTPTR